MSDQRFRPGDSVIYTASDPLRSPNIDAYPAIVYKSSGVPGVEPAKYQIEYTKDGKKIRAWVQAKRLTPQKVRKG